MELADPARIHAGSPSRVQERLAGALERGLELERRMHRLDGALRPEIAAPRDATEAPPLLRKLLGGREVHAGDLEQRDLLVALVLVVGRRGDEAFEQGRAQDRVFRRERLGEPPSHPGADRGRRGSRCRPRE